MIELPRSIVLEIGPNYWLFMWFWPDFYG